MQGLSHARTGAEGSVAGTFRSVVDAERALEALRAQGVPPDRVSMVMGESNSQSSARIRGAVMAGDEGMEAIAPEGAEREGEARGTNVGGGAATGATLGGLVGILWGWISGSSVATVPGAVATVSSGILTSTITGLAIGAAVGGLVGGLVGAGMPEVEPAESEDGNHERRILVTVLSSGDGLEQARATLMAQGATEVQAISDFDAGISDLEEANNRPQPSLDTEPRVEESTDREEDKQMADEGRGVDPDSVTGTRDAIDPETGAIGTGGTPLTGGYGVSGSTIGLGTPRGENEQASGDFRGEMPDTKAYDMGGRGSDDAPDEGKSHDVPVEAKNTDLRVDEAHVQSEPQTRDVFEAGPSYATPTETVSSEASGSGGSAGSEVDNAPTSANIPVGSSNESGGNSTPGTSDVAGLGDNTDDRSGV